LRSDWPPIGAAERFRRAFAECCPVLCRKSAKFPKAEAHRDLSDTLGAGIGAEQRLSGRGQPQLMKIAVRCCATDQPQRSRQRPVARADGFAKVRDRVQSSEILTGDFVQAIHDLAIALLCSHGRSPSGSACRARHRGRYGVCGEAILSLGTVPAEGGGLRLTFCQPAKISCGANRKPRPASGGRGEAGASAPVRPRACWLLVPTGQAVILIATVQKRYCP